MLVQRASIDEFLKREARRPELADGQRGAVQATGRHHCGDTRTIWQSRVEDGLFSETSSPSRRAMLRTATREVAFVEVHTVGESARRPACSMNTTPPGSPAIR